MWTCIKCKRQRLSSTSPADESKPICPEGCMKIEAIGPNKFRITREPRQEWPDKADGWAKLCNPAENMTHIQEFVFPGNCGRLICEITFGE